MKNNNLKFHSTMVGMHQVKHTDFKACAVVLQYKDQFKIKLKVTDMLNQHVVVSRSLPRDGGMAEDHGPTEASQLPRAWARGCKETESCL